MSPNEPRRSRAFVSRTPSAGLRCRSCCSGWRWPPSRTSRCRSWKRSGKPTMWRLNSPDAPSLKAIKRIGQAFHEFDTDSSAMIVLEGDKPLGADAHQYYDAMVRKLEQDKKHVEHVQDFWGDTLTAAGSQSRTARPRMFRCFSRAIRARRWPTSPLEPFATSSTTRNRHRVSRPMSPARRRSSPISSTWAAREPQRSPR